VHLLAKDLEWRTPQLNAAVASSQTLWLEVIGADDPKVVQPILTELGIDAAHPLSSKLSKEQLGKLDTEAKSFNMSEAMLEPMRPWLASLTLGVAPLLQSGADPNSGVESILTAEFKKNQRQVAGFETVSQQFHFFAHICQRRPSWTTSTCRSTTSPRGRSSSSNSSMRGTKGIRNGSTTSSMTNGERSIQRSMKC